MEKINNSGIKQNNDKIINTQIINENTVKNTLINGKQFYQKTKVLNEKILLILPCNAGARFGNYFLGGAKLYNNWILADNLLSHLRPNDMYMAANSSVNYHFNDNDGALVFEHEMHRVSSDGDFGLPNLNRFNIIKDTADFDINELISNLEIGLKRAVNYGFEHIVTILTPLAYKIGMVSAINNLNLWNKVTFFDINSMGGMGHYLKMVKLLYLDGFKEKGIYEYLPLKYKSIGESIPDKFKYNTNSFKKNEIKIAILQDNHNNYYQHPIFSSDEFLPHNDIKQKYNLNINDTIVHIYKCKDKLKNINVTLKELNHISNDNLKSVGLNF